MSRPSIRHLEVLQAAVEHASFSAAAAQLHITQAAVSSSMRELEQLMHVKLFMRQPGQGSVPTATARRMAAEAAGVLRRLDDLPDIAAERSTSLSGSVTFGCVSTFSAHIVPALIAEMRDAYPGLSVRLVEARPNELLSRFTLGQIDLALFYDRQLPAQDAAVELARVHPHVVLPGSHHLACLESVELAELREESLLTLDTFPTHDRLVSLVASMTGQTPHVGWSTSSSETLYSLVARGLGYSIAYISPTNTTTYDGGEVSYVRISDPVAPNRLVGLASGHQLNHRHLDPRQQAVASTLRHVIRGLEEEQKPNLLLQITPP